MKKYYYQLGRCPISSYLSQNPVIYESTEEKDKYKKIKMDCHKWENGRTTTGECPNAVDCPLFHSAPDVLIDDHINLRNKKLDE